MDSALEDEVLSINAIYSPDTLVAEGSNNRTYILRIPSSNISLRLAFPASYPDEDPPEILGPESSGSESRKGDAGEMVAMARETFRSCFQPGGPCIYDLLEDLIQQMESIHGEEGKDASTVNIQEAPSADDSAYSAAANLVNVNPQWFLSEQVTEKKSIFIARAARATSVEEAQSFIQHLVATNKKAAKATHNISAWRMRDAMTGASFQDSDDDGETAAGGRLLHLLQVMDVWNVVVVVSR